MFITFDIIEGIDLDDQLADGPAYSVIVDNPTASWLWVAGTGRSVQPLTCGAVLPIRPAIKVAQVRWSMPRGSEVPTGGITRGRATVVFTDAALASSDGATFASAEAATKTIEAATKAVAAKTSDSTTMAVREVTAVTPATGSIEVPEVLPAPRVWRRAAWVLVAAACIVGLVLLAGKLSNVQPAGGGSMSPTSDSQIDLNDLRAGLNAQLAGHLADAATDYQKSIAHDADNKFAYYDLGVVEQLMGQTAAAEQNWRSAIQIDPNFVPALFNLAILRTGPSPFEAEELYRHVISVQPDNAGAHLNLGFLLRSTRRIAEGNMELATAVQLDPSIASRIPPGTLASPKPAKSSPSPR